jgi:hypothetical protein
VKRFLPLVPPALLCLVAIGQVYLARARDLSPWKGGGFGMFSTNDDEFRRIEVWIDGPEGEQELDVSRDLRITKLTAYPTEDRLTDLARTIMQTQQARGLEVTKVRVAVWRTDFTLETKERRDKLIREVIIDQKRSFLPR